MSITMPKKQNIRLCDVTQETPTSFSSTARVTYSLLKRSKNNSGKKIYSFKSEIFLGYPRDDKFVTESPDSEQLVFFQRGIFCLLWPKSCNCTAVGVSAILTFEPNSVSLKAGYMSG